MKLGILSPQRGEGHYNQNLLAFHWGRGRRGRRASTVVATAALSAHAALRRDARNDGFQSLFSEAENFARQERQFVIKMKGSFGQ